MLLLCLYDELEIASDTGKRQNGCMVHEAIAVRTSSCRFFSSRDGCDWKKQIGGEKQNSKSTSIWTQLTGLLQERSKTRFRLCLGDWSVSGLLLIASLVPRDARCRISCTGWMGWMVDGWMGGARTVKLLFFFSPGRGCARGGRMCGWVEEQRETALLPGADHQCQQFSPYQ